MSKAKRIYLITGEASGDLHASNLLKALYRLHPDLEVMAWAGDECQKSGAKIVKHYNELSFMGFLEVVQNLGTIRQNFTFCKKELATQKPDLVLLVDFSGFNLRIAKYAKSIGLNVCYYISPQVWASRSSRVKDIEAYTDMMLTILPFEQDFYKEKGVSVDYVGHPLLDVISQYEPKQTIQESKPIVALLPGSRKQEIRKMLPTMVDLARAKPDYAFKVAMAPTRNIAFYKSICPNQPPNLSYLENQTYDLLKVATFAIVTSGTATLETALFEVPQIVCYKANWISYAIAKQIIKVKYISLVNLILDKEVVPELIQGDYNLANVKSIFETLNTDATEMQAAYKVLQSKLGNAGASETAAQKISARFL